MREDRLKKGQEVHVFVVLHHKIGVVGPWFVDEIPDGPEGTGRSRILTGRKYVWMLENWVFPELRDRQGSDLDTMIWQQDGTAPYTCQESLNFLFKTLGEHRVISSRGSAGLPPGFM